MKETIARGAAAAMLGGSFNPVHVGHVRIAEKLQRLFAFSPLWVVPTGKPPHKAPYTIATKHRVEMVKRAFQDIKGARLSRTELDRRGASYAIDTIRALRRRHPTRELFFILGADAFRDLPSWHRFPQVLKACSFLVVSRSGQAELTAVLRGLESKGLLRKQPVARPFSRGYVTSKGTRVLILPLVLPAVSSTEVRVLAAQKRSLKSLVPDDVARYLKTHSLYVTGEKREPTRKPGH